MYFFFKDFDLYMIAINAIQNSMQNNTEIKSLEQAQIFAQKS